MLGRIWRTEYDAKNRVASTTDSLGRKNQIEYNVGDELIKTTSPSGRVMTYTYDVRRQRASVKDPLNGVVNFTYDFRGNLTTLQDQRGNTTTWTYDELYRATGMRDPLGRASVIESYDANDNVKATIDRLGRRVVMDYDALDRAQTVTYSDATVSYQYDAAGRTTRIDDTQSGFAQWSYDNANRVLSETTNNGVVSYGYNDANQRTAMTALNRTAVNYGYDTAGRLSTITQGAEVFTYSYDSLSRRSNLQRPNGVTTSYAYDEVNRLKRLTHANAVGNIEDLQYSYNLNDEISAITSLNSATTLPTAKTATPANSANRISQVGTANYQFDNHGQTTSKTDASGTTNYSWDARGRLTKATLPYGQSVDYGFDALGRRASRSYQGTATNFVYDDDDVVADKVGANVTTDYLNGTGIDDKLRQSAASTGSLYFLQDHLGSTNALTSAGGGIVERLNYEAFGNHSNSSLTRFTYTGREDDSATGMMYYRARWYDSGQGRFVTEDPIGFEGGMNLYAYVEDDPLNDNDPFGLKPKKNKRTISANTSFRNAAKTFADYLKKSDAERKRNLSVQRDIFKMVDLEHDLVAEMTKNGERYPGSGMGAGSWNNLRGYVPCVGQANRLKDALGALKASHKFENEWDFYTGTDNFVPSDFGLDDQGVQDSRLKGHENLWNGSAWHRWVLAVPKDKKLAMIRLDPWKNDWSILTPRR